MQYLAVLGRQPKISVAELENLFSNVKFFGGNLASFESDGEPNINRLGGTIKLARPLDISPEKFLLNLDFGVKYVIGVSDYSRGGSARKSQMLALKIKRVLKKQGKPVRVLDNKAADLSTATVFHNQLGEKPGHFELIKYNSNWYVGAGVQNINAYRDRDQSRPARDAKVGMLPPKLAQILINLCGKLSVGVTVLDPFCGTGVVLQEATLMGYKVYGTDLEPRMIEYSKKNLEWLAKNLGTTPTGAPSFRLSVGDAQDFTWEQPVDAVACEAFLGQPMSQPPVEIKLKQEKERCRTIILGFLKNLSSQIKKDTPVVIAVPAWLRPSGQYSRLNILDEVEKLGYNVLKYHNLSQADLLYFRDGQIVAREIIVLRKK